MAITGHFRMFPKFLWRYALLFAVQGIVVAILSILLIRIYKKVFPPFHVLEIRNTFPYWCVFLLDVGGRS